MIADPGFGEEATAATLTFVTVTANLQLMGAPLTAHFSEPVEKGTIGYMIQETGRGSEIISVPRCSAGAGVRSRQHPTPYPSGRRSDRLDPKCKILHPVNGGV